jgi:DNA modification methylase
MTPYYSADGITIYNADCREIVPGLDAKSLVVTDIPYNIKFHYQGYKDNLKDDVFKELLKIAVRAPSVVLCYPEIMFDVYDAVKRKPEECVAWVYNTNTPRQHRQISWFGTKPDFSKIKQPYKNPNDKRIKALMKNGSQGTNIYDWWEVQQVKNVSAEKTEFPCQIPLEIMKRIIMITDADIIVDPFMGSGTTLLAAKELGKKAIGIELVERHCQIAVERIKKGL